MSIYVFALAALALNTFRCLPDQPKERFTKIWVKPRNGNAFPVTNPNGF